MSEQEIPKHLRYPMEVDLEGCQTDRVLVIHDILTSPGRAIIYTDGGTILITGVDLEGRDFLQTMRTEQEYGQ